RHGNSTQVADVLAHRLAAVDLQSRHWRIGLELRAQLCRALFELLRIVRRPPIAEVAVAVRLPALIVEAVADLVADDRSDRAVVDRIVGIDVEERRLENARRER